MILDLFKSKPIVDEDTRQWLYSAYAWLIEHFDGDYFAQSTQLILPTREFFPAPASSVEQMAANVFEQVKAHMGLNSFPFQLVSPHHFLPQQYQIQHPVDIYRGQSNNTTNTQLISALGQTQLTLSYDPIQLKQPQVMVANYAAMFSNYLLSISGQPIPGGEEHRAPAVELLAIFMGFGVMFTNTAYAFRGSCASCHVHAANRVAVLTENESVYALAIFCALKNIEAKTVTPQLKSHLKGMFKQALKQVKKDTDNLNTLRLLLPNPTNVIKAS